MNPQFSTFYTLAHEREDEIRKEATRHHAESPSTPRGRLAGLLREVAVRIAPAPAYSREYVDEQSR